VRRFFQHYKPRLGIIMETEIWPNLFDAASKFGTPLMIANGRLSERSMRGYARLSSLIAPSLRAVHRFAAQSQEDADRYLNIGATQGTVFNCGNIKYDIEWHADQVMASRLLRTSWFGDRKVMVAGSTHPGEESLVLTAFRHVRRLIPDALLILVPRHPERGRSVLELCRTEGFISRLFSKTIDLTSRDDVLVIDRVGELRRFYGACEVAFIGGSLVPHGGQNPLEPLIAGIPVIFGPHMNNFREIRQSILDARAGVEVRSAEELADQVMKVFEHPEEAHRMGERGEAMVRQNQGALNRIYEITAALLLQPVSSSL
jgi:3-deoxy-D-manno-octulosonic-acid transferase